MPPIFFVIYEIKGGVNMGKNWEPKTLDIYFGNGAGKIGNYVHLYAGSYLNHGTKTKGKRNKFNYVEQKNRLKDLTKAELERQNLSKGRIKELENFLNYVFKTSGARVNLPKPNEEFYSQEFQEHEEEIFQMIQDKLIQEVDKAQIDQDTRNVSNANASGNTGTSILKKIKTKQKQKNIQVQNILNHIQMIEKYREQLAKGVLQNQNITVEKIDSVLKNIKNNFSALLKETQNLDLGRKAKSKISNMQKDELKGFFTLDNTGTSDLITDINSLINEIKGPSINQIKGDLAELIVGSINIAELLRNHTFSEIQNTLLDNIGVVGDKRSPIVIDLDNFVAGKHLGNILSKDYKMDDINLTLRSKGLSQDKIDVEITVLEKPIKASVKNVNLQTHRNINIASSGSLLAMIQHHNENQFINHYLNIMAQHPKKVVGFKEKTKNGEESKMYKKYKALVPGAQELQKSRRYAQIAMGMTMLYSSLVGYKGGVLDRAGVFIVNDNSTGTFKIVNSYNLLNYIFKEDENYINNAKVTYSGKANFSFKNNYAETAYFRIANLMNEIHATKVKAMINFNDEIANVNSL